jgi:predicted RNA-binding Zn-ribbon protein involved in translation (DUF1610 family)
MNSPFPEMFGRLFPTSVDNRVVLLYRKANQILWRISLAMSYSDASKLKKQKTRSKVVTFPSTQRITCPECGNNKEFLEVSDGVILTTRFIQHSDGSFSQELDDSQVLGQVKFYCGDCGADLTQFHKRFLEMLF